MSGVVHTMRQHSARAADEYAKVGLCARGGTMRTLLGNGVEQRYGTREEIGRHYSASRLPRRSGRRATMGAAGAVGKP